MLFIVPAILLFIALILYIANKTSITDAPSVQSMEKTGSNAVPVKKSGLDSGRKSVEPVTNVEEDEEEEDRSVPRIRKTFIHVDDFQPENGRGEISGYVLYTDRTPVRDAIIEMKYIGKPPEESAPNIISGSDERSFFTDERGCFSIGSLLFGNYSLAVFDRNDARKIEVLVTNDKPSVKIEVLFGLKGSIFGEVVDLHSNPIVQAKVDIYFCAGNRPWGAQLGKGIPQRRDMPVYSKGCKMETDSNGKYQVFDVPPIECRIRIEKAGFEYKNIFVNTEEGQETKVRTVLLAAATISGKVILAESLLPIGYDVARSRKNIRLWTIVQDRKGDFSESHDSLLFSANQEGSFSFYVERFMQKTIVYARAPGFRPKRIEIDVKAGESKYLEINLDQRGGVFSGKVVFRENQPKPKVEISVGRNDSGFDNWSQNSIVKIVPDESGEFIVDCLDHCEHHACFYFDYGNEPSKFGIRPIEMTFTPDRTGVVVQAP